MSALDEYAQIVADRLPPLSDAQRRTIAGLLAGAAVTIPTGASKAGGGRHAATAR